MRADRPVRAPVPAGSIMNDALLRHIIEAALMAAPEPLSLSAMENLFEDHERPDRARLRTVLDELGMDCRDRGYHLRQLGDGWRFQTNQDLAPWISRLWAEKPPRYGRALLETLALIAYRQPVSRAEIEQVRGVAVSSHIIRTLTEREWVRVVGYKEVPGRPALFGTTRQFLEYFNLRSLDDLPTLAELRDLDVLAPTGDDLPSLGMSDEEDAFEPPEPPRESQWDGPGTEMERHG